MSTIEIERKWLFDMESIPKTIPCIGEYLYEQAYLSTNPEVRIRKKQDLFNKSKVTTYVLCLKSKGSLSRIEVQKSVTKDEFEQLMEIGKLSSHDFIKKQPKRFVVDGHILTVGISDLDRPTKFCYGEIEFESELEANNFVPPDWFGKEVTDDQSYKMVNYWVRTRLKPQSPNCN